MADIKLNQTIKAAMILKIICGFFCKISSNKIVITLAKVYCLFFGLMCMSMLRILANHARSFSALLQVFLGVYVYLIYFLLNFYFEGENFMGFLHELRKVVTSQHMKSSEGVQISIRLFTISLSANILLRLKITLDHSQYTVSSIYSFLVFQSTVNLLEFSPILTRLMMFELLWRRMAMVRRNLERELSTHQGYDNSDCILKEKLRRCLNAYKCLLEVTRVNETPMKIAIFTSVTALVFYILTTTHLYISASGELANLALAGELINHFIILLSPALLSEMVIRETDKMKLCIVKRLLVCEDERTLIAIQDAMTYLEQNPFKYTIWRVFAVDMSLILNMIALLTTYTVAMVQFMHICD
ncbi:uncharacterized protein LOC124632931 [Helicoverpa zea]|uniref:uncharacterized protein LOC124632931 n=1 Tax=Helicoverpa zea TaxID=7113 RepID=UPI001F5A4B76|nr:uncharacterized protein LOC124632931 [Helicoverpa zea]